MTQPPNYRLLAIDLDGTLLAPDGSLSPRNRDALHRAHAAGLKVVLCTGRSYPETRPVLDRIGLDLDAAITAGGALITDARTHRTLDVAPMAAETARELLAWFRDEQYTVLWLHDSDTTGYDGYAIAGPKRHPAIDIWLGRSRCRMRVVEPAAGPFGDGYSGGVTSPLRMTVIDADAVLRDVLERMTARFGPRVTQNLIHVPAYDFTVIECFGAGVDKWRGVAALCDRWGIDRAATVAVGDDVNDVPMLAAAGLGVAMKNARKAARQVAARTVSSNADDGVAELIDWLLDAPQAQYHLWLNTHGSKSP